MASGGGGRINFTKLGMAVVDELTGISRDLLMIDVKPASIERKMKNSKNLPKLRPEQELLVNKAKHTGYTDFDITLLYTFLRNECPTIPPPTKGWGNVPGPTDITVGDDIERIRLIRNKVLGHISTTTVPDSEFQNIWTEIKAVCQRMENYLGSTHSYVQNLEELENRSVDEELENLYTEKLNTIRKNEQQWTEILQEINQRTEALSDKVDEVKSDVQQLKGKRKYEAIAKVTLEAEKRNKQSSIDFLLETEYEILHQMVQSIHEDSSVEYVLERWKGIQEYAFSIKNKEQLDEFCDIIIQDLKVKLSRFADIDDPKGFSILREFLKFVRSMRERKGELEVELSSLILHMGFQHEQDFIQYQKDVQNGTIEKELSQCLLFQPLLEIFGLHSTDVIMKLTDITKTNIIGLTIGTETPTKKYMGCNQCAQHFQYYCKTCQIKLCSECRKQHDSAHDVVDYSEKVELCNIHTDLLYILCCRQCEIPVCEKCVTESHKNHVLVDIDDVFNSKMQEYSYSIRKVEDEFLPDSTFLLEDVQADGSKYKEIIAMMQLTMISKAQMLKDTVDTILAENMKFLQGLQNSIVSELQKQENLLKDHIEYLENIVYEYNRSTSSMSHATFILFQNERPLDKIEEIPNLTEIHFPIFSDYQVKKEDIAKMFGEIRKSTKAAITRKVAHKQRVRKTGTTVKVLPTATKILTFTAPGIRYGAHISPVAMDQAWISDSLGTLVLTDTKGRKRTGVTLADERFGCHTTSETGDLIFLNKHDNCILKVTANTTTPKVVTKVPSNTVCSIYSSPANGDILVGMVSDENKSKVVRYNKTGKMVHEVQYKSTGKLLYEWPHYITENRINKDICVSDYNKHAVVVVDRERNHRFSYTGHPPGADLQPMGISTDTQGRILVSDFTSDTVHMTNKDGIFLSFLLTITQGIEAPVGLSLDVKNNILWVGYNKISVYKYKSENLIT